MSRDNGNHNSTGTLTQEEIRYRVIQDQELEILHSLFTRLGWAMPDPNMCKVVVAEAGTGPKAMICAMGVVQFVAHAEPMWVHPDLRGTGIAEGLVLQMKRYLEVDCNIKRYMCIAKVGSFGARLCEKYGMVPYDGQVYVRQVE